MIQIPACPLCKSQANKSLFSERGYTLFSCSVCELFFIDPYPADNEMVHGRISEYDYDEIKILDPASHYRAEVEYYKNYFPQIARECEGARSVLDVGCGTGHLLERLNIFPDLYRNGIELNSARAEMARKVSGCDIFQIPIENFTSEIKYDVITMINVLSHIPSFQSLFTSVRSLLSDQGKFIVKTGELIKGVKKGDIFDWGIPDHLHFLGLNTMDFICREFDFRICKHDRIPISRELFSPETWKSPGRSAVRNKIKSIVVNTPFVLPFLARCYELTRGIRIYSSLFVLSPLNR